MKKLSVVFVVLMLLAISPTITKAETIGFDLGILSMNSREKTADSGTGSFMAITFPVDNNTKIGFYNEGMSFNLKDNNAGGAPSIVPVDVDITAIQITRKLVDTISIGFDLGMADVSDTTAFGFVSDTVPMADVFVKWSLLSGGEKVTTNLCATLGYRLLSISPTDPDGGGGDFTKAVDDLGGLWLKLSVGLNF